MALRKNFSLSFYDRSIILPDAYCKICKVSGDKGELHYDINIMDLPEGKSYRVLSYKFVPDMEGKNFILQAYLHAKTLPEFASAVDC